MKKYIINVICTRHMKLCSRSTSQDMIELTRKSVMPVDTEQVHIHEKNIIEQYNMLWNRKICKTHNVGCPTEHAYMWHMLFVRDWRASMVNVHEGLSPTFYKFNTCLDHVVKKKQLHVMNVPLTLP